MKRARELFALERRSVGSPYVHEMWWTRSEPVEAFVSVATSHWVMVVTRQRNATTVTVRGPETRATSVPIPEDAEFFGNSEEGDTIQTDLLMASDVVLMGRRTYDGFAPVWSGRSGDPYSDRINAMRKVVVSTTLDDPQWTNTEVVAEDVVDRIRGLKKEDGGHIVQYGFGDVSRLLLEHGLIDQLRLWIHPQLVGPSDVNDLLYRPDTTMTLRLVESRVLSNGIIVATYTP